MRGRQAGLAGLDPCSLCRSQLRPLLPLKFPQTSKGTMAVGCAHEASCCLPVSATECAAHHTRAPLGIGRTACAFCACPAAGPDAPAAWEGAAASGAVRGSPLQQVIHPLLRRSN